MSVDGGRQRARRAYPGRHTCSREGCNAVAERHHRDGDTRNNAPENIELLCNKHHKEADGRMQRPEFRRAWRKAMVGRTLTPEHRAKISAGLVGRECSDQTRRKLSEAMRDRYASQPAPTHCVNGHEYDKRNRGFQRNGWRTCRECARIRARIAYHAKKGRAA